MTQNLVHMRGGFGLAFNAASRDTVAVYQSLKKAGVECEASNQFDGTFYIGVKNTNPFEGVPLSGGFINRVRALGGRFTSHPMARMLNNPRHEFGA